MKTSVYIATTLDGYIARDNGDLDWLPGSDGRVDESIGDEDYGYNAFMASVDTLVMGRKTYELVIAFGVWPYDNKRVIVMSNTLKDVAHTAELRACPVDNLYQELLASGAKHVYVDGGKTIQGFLKAGLINAITITRVPVLIGSGMPLFGELEQDCRLKHIETQSYKNGFVQSTYAVIPEHK